MQTTQEFATQVNTFLEIKAPGGIVQVQVGEKGSCWGRGTGRDGTRPAARGGKFRRRLGLKVIFFFFLTNKLTAPMEDESKQLV